MHSGKYDCLYCFKTSNTIRKKEKPEQYYLQGVWQGKCMCVFVYRKTCIIYLQIYNYVYYVYNIYNYMSIINI